MLSAGKIAPLWKNWQFCLRKAATFPYFHRLPEISIWTATRGMAMDWNQFYFLVNIEWLVQFSVHDMSIRPRALWCARTPRS